MIEYISQLLSIAGNIKNIFLPNIKNEFNIDCIVIYDPITPTLNNPYDERVNMVNESYSLLISNESDTAIDLDINHGNNIVNIINYKRLVLCDAKSSQNPYYKISFKFNNTDSKYTDNYISLKDKKTKKYKN